VRERDLIQYIRNLASQQRLPSVEVGIGDDAALVRLPGGGRVVVTTDMLIEGTHFQPAAAPEAVGRKAIARALSDLAAMAAKPLCTVAAVSFGPGADGEFCRRLSEALWEASREFSAPLVGGDVSSGTGALTLTVTALGVPGPGGVVTRSGARAGDLVCVTGSLGGALSGGRHLTFAPRLNEALELAGRFELHAMIDISDGLSTDALHLARESGCGVIVQAADIPVSDEARALARAEGNEDLAARHALDDGEDYELLFCAPQADARAAAHSGVMGLNVSVIGTVIQDAESFIIWPDGTREPLLSGGWEHLST